MRFLAPILAFVTVSIMLVARPAKAADVVPIGGHAQTTVMTFSPDGGLLLTGGNDNTLKLWEVATGRLLRTLAGHTSVDDGSNHNGIGALAVSRDGKWAASAGADKLIRIWDLETGRTMKTLAANGLPIRALTWTPDGQYVVAGAAHSYANGKSVYDLDRDRSPQTLSLWHVESERRVHDFGGHKTPISDLALTGNGVFVVSGEIVRDGKAIRVWSLADGKLVRSIESSAPIAEGSGGGPEGFSLDSAGTRVYAIIAKEQRIEWKSWAIATGQAGPVLAVDLSANTSSFSVIASGSTDSVLVSLSTGERGSESFKHWFESWSRDTNRIIRSQIHISDQRPVIGALAGNGGRAIAAGPTLEIELPGGAKHTVSAAVQYNRLEFAAGGDSFLARGTIENQGLLTTWDLRTLAARVPFNGQAVDDYGYDCGFANHLVDELKWSSDLNRLNYFGPNLLGRVFRLTDGSCETRVMRPWSDQILMTVKHSEETIIQIDRAARPRWLATYAGVDNQVRIWSLETFKVIRGLGVAERGAAHVYVSPRGRYLAWDSPRGVEVRDLEKGTQRKINDAHEFSISADDALIATIKKGHLTIRSLIDLRSVAEHKFNRLGARQDFPYHPHFLTNDLLMLGVPRVAIMIDMRSKAMIRMEYSSGALTRMKSIGDDIVAIGKGRAELFGKMGVYDAASPGLRKLYTIDTPWIDGISRSADGATIASPDKLAVRLLDASTGHERGRLTGHLAEVRTTTFSPDGSRLLSGSADGTVRLWDLATGKTIVIMIAARDGRWFIQTPEGFFAASSPAAAELQSIVSGFKTRGIDQVWQSLYSPDLVRAKLAGDEAEVKRAAEQLDLDRVLQSGEPPRLTLTALRTDGSIEVVDVEVQVDETDGGTGRIEWRLNDTTVAVATKPAGAGRTFTLKRQIALDPDANTIAVVAYNARNALASPPVRTTASWNAASPRSLPVLHVLAIGIDSYSDTTFRTLTYARSDAAAVAEAFGKIGADRGRYSDHRITVLPEKQATRSGLAAAFKRTADGMNARDTFVLFIAGHGTSREGRFYLIPYGYRRGTSSLAETAIGQDDLQAWLANHIIAKRSLVLLDTCASGALVGGAQQSRLDNAASETAVGRLHEAIGRPVLTAAATGKAAAEGDKQRGVFTNAVLEGLSRAGDKNEDGKIELRELFGYVQARVPELAALVGGTAQARGAATRPAHGSPDTPPLFKQSARAGARGDNFEIGRRLE